MRIVIFGASGLLGKALVREWSGDVQSGQWPVGQGVPGSGQGPAAKDHELVLLNSSNADIRDASQVQQVVGNAEVDWIILSAAYTDVDGCESNRELAFSVNRDGAVNVAQAARRAGSKLVFLSSDYVFDGTKSSAYETGDARNPQSVYGRTKAEAEIGLLEVLPDCCIVRTSWLFGAGGKCFPDTILKLAASRTTLDVVNDQRGSPTYTTDLAQAIVQLCRKDATGIIHVTNGGDCTWFEFAQLIVREAGMATEVRPVSSGQMARPAPRPAYSVLSPKSRERFDVAMPSWQDACRRYLQERALLPG